MRRASIVIALCCSLLPGLAVRATAQYQDEPYGEQYGEPYGEAYGDQDAYPPSSDESDPGDFYDALAPYGDWVEDDTYGRVWYPVGVPDDWQPYTDGQWIWTDLGWTWDSDWSWGWATFHYGRWFRNPRFGWCWVPGGEWAPAWVAWRTGGDWVGWAPLPPDLRWRAGVGFGYVDWDRVGLGYGWNFCRAGQLPGPGIQRRLLPRAKAGLVFRDTRNVTRYGFAGSHIANRSLGLDRVRRAYGRDIRAYRIQDSERPIARRGGRLQHDRFYAYRPRIAAAPREPSWQTTRGAQGERRLAPAERGRAFGRAGRYGEERRSHVQRPTAPGRQIERRGPGRSRQPGMAPARRAPAQKGAPADNRGGRQGKARERR